MADRGCCQPPNAGPEGGGEAGGWGAAPAHVGLTVPV